MNYKRIDPVERLPGNNKSGAEYEPYIQVTDFASQGIVSRIKDRNYSRLHHLLSGLKRDIYLLLEDYLVNKLKAEKYDIYEQKALDINETIDIANEFGCRHPWDYKTGELKYMTTDLYAEAVVKGELKQIAVNCKDFNKTQSARFQEKFEVESEYWRRRDVDLILVTEKDISKTKIKNIILLRDLADPNEEQEMLLKPLLRYLTTRGFTLKEACLEFAGNFGISFADSFYLVKVLIKRGWLKHDLKEPIELWNRYNERDL